MMATQLDHLTITTPSLELGKQFIQEKLGVIPQIGGEHVLMGTHNLLLKLADDLFLEVIAPNPYSPQPQRTRWFGLDSLASSAQAQLRTWVVRTTDIRHTLEQATEDLGQVISVSRQRLQWLMSILEDGELLLGGVLPALIEWQVEQHPAQNLTDLGVSLSKLELYHPDPQRVTRLLNSLQLNAKVSVVEGSEPKLLAYLQTANGEIIL
ncbi:MAG: VOC family protein [Thiolinea sp.]